MDLLLSIQTIKRIELKELNMKMEKRFDPLIIRFIDLIDQKYKENILHSVDIFNKLGKRSYNSLREAIEDDDVEFVSHALNDLSTTDFY